MSAQNVLDQLLRNAQGALSGSGLLRQDATGARGLSDLGKGALAGGALGLLLSNKRVRKMGGTLAMYGGAAALAALAYKTYGDWQSAQRQSAVPTPEPRLWDAEGPAAVEQQSRAILKALVAAAKADGHIDARERELIETELARLEISDPELRRWLKAEIEKPLDPAEVATAAQTPELASEMYLASRLVIDQESWMERAYVDELSRRLCLAPSLRAQLDAQVASLGGG